MKILVTGSNGFIARNLIIHLKYSTNHELVTFNRDNNISELKNVIKDVDFIFHLAGINRPKSEDEYDENFDLTKNITEICKNYNRRIPIIFSSSTQALLENKYGVSKKKAESYLQNYNRETGSAVGIYRLTNVFGKWSKPNYNSVVATFCNNVAKNEKVNVDNPESEISLVYIDDVIESFLKKYESLKDIEFIEVKPVYTCTVQSLLNKINKFNSFSDHITLDSVGTGFDRALYSTFISYLPKDRFSYSLKENIDYRGKFVEILRTPNMGQISFLTAPPGITRGCHFHHTKTEKFIVVHGSARIKYRNLLDNDSHEIIVNESSSTVVETIPGWVHDITNIGKEKLVVMIWTNEIFNPSVPDTYAEEI